MTHPKTNSEFTDKMGVILVKAMEETIGRDHLKEVLEQANAYQSSSYTPAIFRSSSIQFSDIRHVQIALEKFYGLRGSQGLALRSGRACFKYGLREFGAQLGFTETAFRLLPLNVKIFTAAQQFAKILNESGHKSVWVEEDPSRFFLHIENCPFCQGRHSDVAVCHLAVGLLQEALYWISGGKHFHIEETNCIAKGDPRCSLVIQKQALE